MEFILQHPSEDIKITKLFDMLKAFFQNREVFKMGYLSNLIQLSIDVPLNNFNIINR